MKVGERLLELKSYFQRTPNPVRGPDGCAALVLCFPTGPGGCRGGEWWQRGQMKVWWVRVLAALSGPRP